MESVRTMNHPTRGRVRIFRPHRFKFKPGDRVYVEAEYTGGYFGHVTECVPKLTMSASTHDDTQVTKPGYFIDADFWDGTPVVGDPMGIQAHEGDVFLASERPDHVASARKLSWEEWEAIF